MSANKEREALLPCPFCGGSANFGPYKSDGLVLKCSTLGCVKREQRTLRMSIEWLRESMTTDWNRRANLPSTSTDGAQAADPQWLADQVKNGIADFISDHWPDRRHGLGDIVANVQRIEVNAARIILLAGAAASPKEHP